MQCYVSIKSVTVHKVPMILSRCFCDISAADVFTVVRDQLVSAAQARHVSYNALL